MITQQTRGLLGSWLFVFAALVALAVPAAADMSGPMAGFDSGTWTFDDVKSPSLANSGLWGTTWAMHVTDGFTYAGFLFALEYDGHELVSMNMTPQGLHHKMEVPGVAGLQDSWEFPGSMSEWQVVSPVAMWFSTSQDYGTYVSTSSLVPLFKLSGMAKNTTPCNNSDIDITLAAWQILHGSSAIAFFWLSEGDWVYQTTQGAWAKPGTGQWIQVTTTGPVTFSDTTGFVATNHWITNTAGYGIEHLPEPASMLLILAGAGTVLTGRARRRRAEEIR